MNLYPSFEGRLSALELRQTQQEALMQDISREMTNQFSQLSSQIKDLSHNPQIRFDAPAKYQIATEQQIDTRFNQIEQRLDRHDQRFDAIEQRLNKHDQRFVAIEQRLDKVEQPLDAIEGRLGSIETVLTQILARLT